MCGDLLFEKGQLQERSRRDGKDDGKSGGHILVSGRCDGVDAGDAGEDSLRRMKLGLRCGAVGCVVRCCAVPCWCTCDLASHGWRRMRRLLSFHPTASGSLMRKAKSSLDG